MDLEIQLVPLVGDAIVDGIEVPVEFDVFMIHVTSEAMRKATGKPFLEIGQVGKNPTYTHAGKVYDTPINWLPAANRFPPMVREKMAIAVQARLAEMNSVDAGTAAAGMTRPVNDAPPEHLADIAEKLVNGESASDSSDVASL